MRLSLSCSLLFFVLFVCACGSASQGTDAIMDLPVAQKRPFTGFCFTPSPGNQYRGPNSTCVRRQETCYTIAGSLRVDVYCGNPNDSDATPPDKQIGQMTPELTSQIRASLASLDESSLQHDYVSFLPNTSSDGPSYLFRFFQDGAEDFLVHIDVETRQADIMPQGLREIYLAADSGKFSP